MVRRYTILGDLGLNRLISFEFILLCPFLERNWEI